jgi:hypothetical protein
MSLTFKRATKHAARLRLAFIGPAGSGKTYSALSVATHLGGKVAVVDTERGSASLYADIFDFDVIELDSFSPDAYVSAIHAAEQAGYDTLIIDSLSHAWTGKDGALEQKDAASRRQGENSFTAWRYVTPKHNSMVDAIVGAKLHVIATMRAKTEYVQEQNEKGKTIIRKVGLAPIQRDGLEYEFSIVGDLDQQNSLVISKTRCPALANKIIERPGEQLAAMLKAWLSSGSPPPAESLAITPEPTPAPETARPSSNGGGVSLVDRIASAATMDELTALRPEVAAVPRGTPTRELLVESYSKRKAELTAP